MSEYNPRPPCNTGGACNGTIDSFTDADDTSMADHVPEHGAWEIHDYTGTAEGWPKIFGNAMESRASRLLSGVTTNAGSEVDIKATMLVEWAGVSVFWFMARWDGSLSNAGDPQGQQVTGGETYALAALPDGPAVFVVHPDGSNTNIGKILTWQFGSYAIDITMTVTDEVKTLTVVEQDTGETVFADSRATEGAAGEKSGLLIRGDNGEGVTYRADSLQVCQPEAGGAAYIRPPCDTSAPRVACGGPEQINNDGSIRV